MAEDYIDLVFGQNGILNSQREGYEPREGQIALARHIDAAFRDGETLLAEGPCGIGKSYAYLVPLLWHLKREAPRRCGTWASDGPSKGTTRRNSGPYGLVVTANIALQNQLVTKDLPELCRVLPFKFSYALYKGKNNYVCKALLSGIAYEFGRGRFKSKSKEELTEIKRVLDWAQNSDCGNKADLSPSSPIWGWISKTASECDKENCSYADECFAENAKKDAKEADVVVTNYHLLFAHAKYEGFPCPSLMVLDEAHKAADIAREFLGYDLRLSSFYRLERAVELLGESYADDAATIVLKEATEFFAALRAYSKTKSYTGRFRYPNFVRAGSLVRVLNRLGSVARTLKAYCTTEDDRKKVQGVQSRCKDLVSAVQLTVRLADNMVIYLGDKESRGALPVIGRLLDPSTFIRNCVVGRVRGTVLTSATMTVAGSFDYIRNSTGTESARELVVDSPFDFGNQTLLVRPGGVFGVLADPRQNLETFRFDVANAMRDIALMCGGRTLCLFSSWEGLRVAKVAFEGKMPFEVLVQQKEGEDADGGMTREALCKRFAENETSVLLGVESFWAGIDVPGPALSCVLIDRIPFPNPKNPIIDALEERDPEHHFANVMLPRAVIALRQGVGRLIRAKSDHGIVAILDPRLWTAKYRTEVLKSLPSMPVVAEKMYVEEFLAKHIPGLAEKKAE